MADEITDDNPNEWQTYEPKQTKQRKKKEKQVSLYSPDRLNWMCEQYNNYFFAIWGKRLNFVITKWTQPYLTSLENRRQLDAVLQTMFWRRPKIWDLMGGSGADGLGAGMHLDPEHLYLNDSMDATGFKLLEHNISELPRIYPDKFMEPDNRYDTEPRDNMTQISIFNSTAIQFIKSYAHHHHLKRIQPGQQHTASPHVIDLVYLDPPWGRVPMERLIREAQMEQNAQITAEKDRQEEAGVVLDPRTISMIEKEVDFATMIRYVDCVVSEMALYNIECSVLCFKNRYHVDRNTFSTYTQHKKIGNDFNVLYAVQATPWISQRSASARAAEPKNPDPLHATEGQFYWAVLQHKHYQSMKDGRHDWDIEYVSNKHFPKPRDFWVETATQLKGPFEPAYGKQMSYPTATWNQPPQDQLENYTRITRNPCPPDEWKTMYPWKDPIFHKRESNPRKLVKGQYTDTKLVDLLQQLQLSASHFK